MGAEGTAWAQEVDQPQQGLDVFGTALAVFQGAQHLHAPWQAVTARCAPAARLTGEELLHVAQQRNHADAVVHGHGQARTHARADLGDATGVHLRVEVLGQQETGTGTAWLPALELEAVAHATGVVFEQLTGGDAERQFPQARVLHLAGEAHQLGAVVFAAFAGQRLVPVVAIGDDGRHVAQGLDVVHAGRLAPHAHGGREGRLGARVGSAAFERVDQCGFFTADVAPGASVHEQLEIETAAQDVLAQQAGSLGFVDGTVEVFRRRGVLATQEDVATIGLQRAGADQHAFDQQMGLLLHQHAVLPGVGLHFIRVAQQVADVHGFIFGHQAPLHARGEAGTAAALEAGILDALHDVVARHLGQGLASGDIAVLGLVLGQPDRLAIVAQAPGQRVGFGRARNAVGRAEGSHGHT